MKIYRIASDFRYVTDCVSSTAEKIDAMLSHPSNVEIDYDKFMKTVDYQDLKSLFSFYDWDGTGGLTLKDDWHVGYYSSVYENEPCVYMIHSAIEYVFVEQGGFYENL